jgi:hypothetical protein
MMYRLLMTIPMASCLLAHPYFRLWFVDHLTLKYEILRGSYYLITIVSFHHDAASPNLSNSPSNGL